LRVSNLAIGDGVELTILVKELGDEDREFGIFTGRDSLFSLEERSF